MNHSWNDVYYTIVKSHVPGDPTHKRISLVFISLFCHSIAQTFENVDVCKGLEDIGRRKNIDFFFEWKDEDQRVTFLIMKMLALC